MSDTPKKIALLLLATVLALGAGEIILRAINYGAITPEMNFGVNTKVALDQGSFLADGDLFWKMPPHPLDGEIRAIQPDEPVPPKGTAQRILVIGDSCSKLSQKIFPYSALLEDTLAADNVEVWNAAVPGYTSWQGRAWLKKQLLATKPDVAVIYFGWNDHWRSTGTTDAAYAAGQKGSSLRLLSLFSKPPAEKPLRVSAAQYQENLTAMVNQLQAQGAAVFLIAAPSNLTDESRQRIVQTGYLAASDNAIQLHRQYLMSLKEVADNTDAVMLNVSGIFAGLKAPRELIMRDGIHLTDRGHQVLAAVLAEVCVPALANGVAGPVDATALARRARAAFTLPNSTEAR